MTDDAGDLDRLRARQAEEDYRLKGPHPAAEKLSAYQANELSPEEDDAIQEHVADCSFCAQRLLDLQRLLVVGAETRGGAVDLETEKEWRRLRRRLDNPVQRVFGSLKTAYSIAAILTLCLVGLALYISLLTEEIRKPVTELSHLTLEARGSRRGGSEQEWRIQPPKILALEIPSTREYPSYRLIFRSQRGGILHSIEDTAADGLITFLLPKGFLDPGDYEIEVLGLQGKTAKTLGVFDLQIKE